MSKGKARVFVPLTKVDEEQRLVYGRITQEVLDKSGEVMDYTTSKPNFEKWSNDFSEKTGGLSKGNLRVMHGLTVAGKLTTIDFNDEDQAIDVCAKVVDDAEWEKVLEGCYTGFSVGGRYGKKWNDTIDGQMVKRYTAIPGEVSLVDDPCVPVATFDCIKADGSIMQKLFKATETEEQTEAPAEEVAEEAAEIEAVGEAEEEVQGELDLSNDAVVAKAAEIAKAAGDGTTWMDHVTTARDELMKAAPKTKGKKDAKAAADEEGKPTDEATEGMADDDKSTKVTPPGIRQVWTASDGTTFEKKADAEAHESKLTKAAEEPKTDAQKLAERLSKAMTEEPATEETGLMEDFDRLSKVVSALSTPFENGQPKLEKGMYTVNRFSNVLSDMAGLSRCIKAEGVREGDDGSDSTVSADIIAAVKSLGKSFIDYASDQVTELLAGMDDEVVVTYYDYYYNVTQNDGEDQLAKDACSLLAELRDPSRERRETLTKAFLVDAGEPLEAVEVEMSGDLQKRFDTLTAENEELKKVATQAVEAVETLTKRVQTIEDTPLPRAPSGQLALRAGDEQFFGKTVTSEADKIEVLKDLLTKHGPDALATMMIKAAHATGGQKLNLKS